jgi:maltooligosyltrehalose trehalohydrolase
VDRSSEGQTVPQLGAWSEAGRLCWRVWAPGHEKVDVVLHDATGKAVLKLPMRAEGTQSGYFYAELAGGHLGQLYKLEVDGLGPFPDPWSRAQPQGVHGPSQVVSADFPWTDSGWRGLKADALVIYEVHVGTATPEGTFQALIPRLASLRALGVNMLELMPLASFPGKHNWGYDGVDLYAPSAAYGGPEGLRRLIDAAHAAGLGVMIDAVYNHFGPDGNYLGCYSPHYFTGRHHTPWGDAVNYDGEQSAPVRELVLRNVEMWIRDYHADGLRLDAAHAIIDDSTPHLLTEIVERARAAGAGREVVIIAEDERNEQRLVTPREQQGLGLDGVWADDFHHQMRRLFAGDSEGYYQDYTGSTEDLAATLRKGWFYEGQRSKNLGHARGTPASGLEPYRFVHCLQNHDQVGNRADGARLGAHVSPAAYRAMSALLLLSPYTPLLFMGQEWNASTPFLYFTDHGEELGRMVTEGRRKEFAGFKHFAETEVPDPQSVETFRRSVLRWEEAQEPEHAGVLALYMELLSLRAEEPCLTHRERGSFDAQAVGANGLLLERRAGNGRVGVLVCAKERLEWPAPKDAEVMLHTEDARFGGSTHDSPLKDGRVLLVGPSAVVLRWRV